MNLKHLTDKVLLSDIKKISAEERQLTLKVLYHLKEIERRRLFSDLGYSSLFDYCVKELGYSNASAARRIQSARLLKEMPFLGRKIADGSITLSNLAAAGTLFKNEGIKEPEKKRVIIERIENVSSKECEKTLMELQSNPTIPKESITMSSPEITTVKFNFTTETMALYEEARRVLAHHRMTNDEVLRKVFKTALEEFKNRKFKLNAKSRSSLSPTSVSPRVSRYVSAIIKKQVYERDKGMCTKCGSSHKLEYDHIKPYSYGGEATIGNLRLLCFSCNQRRLV